jgi:predicted ATP-grasp superfamily ATP-dependent carboligase
MTLPKRVFVFESITATGVPPGLDEPAAAELLREGRAMRDALVADLAALPGVIVTCARGAGECGAWPAGVEGATPDEGEAPADFVARLSRAHDAAWIIAPETGGELAVLCAAVPAGRRIGCSTEAIRLASSKNATRTRLAAAGIAVPASEPVLPDSARETATSAPSPQWTVPGAGRRAACADEPSASAAIPATAPHRPGAFAQTHAVSTAPAWVVKPDDGAGACATHVYADFAAARAAAGARRAAGEAIALEAWVEGEAMSLSLLVAAGRAEVLSVNRQHIRVDARGAVALEAVSSAVEPLAGPRGVALAALAQRIAAAVPGLAGYVGVDFVWNAARGPVVIEINPRLTLAYVGLSETLGRNIAGVVLEALAAQAGAGGRGRGN